MLTERVMAPDKVAQIITFNRDATRSGLKDVARARHSLCDADRLAKLFLCVPASRQAQRDIAPSPAPEFQEK